jgi:hypothetical protein
MRAVSAVVILDGCGSEGQEFRLKAFGPQYQLGSRSSSRERESLAAGTIKDDEQPSSFLSMRDRTKSMMAMRCPG